jgi:hypothetical protein
VTLGDQEARYRGTQKSVLERKAPPTFDVVVEIQSWERLAVHDNVAQVVDQWLRGYPISPEVRWLDESGTVRHEETEARASESTPAPWRPESRAANGARHAPHAPLDRGGVADEEEEKASEVRVFLFGVGRDKLEAAAVEAGTPVQIVNELRRADLVLTTKTHYRRGSQLVRIAEANGKPVCVLRKNSLPQLQEFLRTVVSEWGRNGGKMPEFSERPAGASGGSIDTAMQEAEDAANRILGGETTVKLAPQRSHIRRLQHMLGQRYNVASVSQGREPERAVMFYRV